MKRVAFLALVALSLMVQEAIAQVQPQYGLRVGGNLAQLSGKDNVFGKNATDHKLGFTVGAFAEYALNPTFALRPELVYTQKGGRIDASFLGEDLGEEIEGDFSSSFHLNYLKLPVLVKYTLPTGGRLRPSFYAGPYVAYTVKRSISFNLGADAGEDLDFAFDAKDTFEPLDYGAILGMDFGYRLARRPATIGVRYNLGLANVLKDAVLAEADDPLVSVNPVARARELTVTLGVTLF